MELFSFEWSKSHWLKRIPFVMGLIMFLSPVFIIIFFIIACVNYDGKIFNRKTQTFIYLFGIVPIILATILFVGEFLEYLYYLIS